ncbi:DUF6934 family protein [Dyadobacter bucti]|uniref:DUF6934 family protein n=1 Tax=Dyadobacter bucti TaxID=2572203 RepID=UPI003F72FB8F
MNYEAYPFILNETNTHYKFQSIGKRGIFEKAVAFSPLTDQIYNLALLDLDPVTQDYVDDTVTDNGDLPQVLATVMAVILEYLKEHPSRYIVLTGNTKSRTRLYQIAIGKVVVEMKDFLNIWGYRNHEWIRFEANRSFESFLIGQKSLDSFR